MQEVHLRAHLTHLETEMLCLPEETSPAQRYGIYVLFVLPMKNIALGPLRFAKSLYLAPRLGTEHLLHQQAADLLQKAIIPGLRSSLSFHSTETAVSLLTLPIKPHTQ